MPQKEFQISNFKFLIFKFLLKFKIIGHSMEPTLKSGDTVLVSSLPYVFKSPQQNDIIAAKMDGKVMIKRITKEEDNSYFLIGDNPNDSYDSRKFGMIARKDILGKVIFIRHPGRVQDRSMT
jgi:nickel-type superoxide dismutase maturation protease